MTPIRRNTLLFSLLILLLGGVPALADGQSSDDHDSDSERHVIRKALRLGGCPPVKFHGQGNVQVLSLSPRGFLGVEASRLTPELRQHFGVPEQVGTMLSRIVDDSAAHNAGLQVGDIITRVDGEDISSPGDLGRAIGQHEGGSNVEIEYWRDGVKLYAEATLAESERCAFDIGDSLQAIRIEDFAELGNLGIEIGGESFEMALETLHETLGSRDWEQHFENLQVIDINGLEERMERVQEQLQTLEKRLEKAYGGDLERALEALEHAEEKIQRNLEELEEDSPDGGDVF